MSQNHNVVSLATLRPLWLGMVCKDDQTYMLTAMPLDSLVAVHKDLLADAMLIFGDTEKSVKAAVDNAFPGYRRLAKKARK